MAELVCVITKELFAGVMNQLPAPNSVAAFAFVGIRLTPDPAAQLLSVTVVVAELTASVTVPTAFDLPEASSCKDRMTFFGSVSVTPGT